MHDRYKLNKHKKLLSMRKVTIEIRLDDLKPFIQEIIFDVIEYIERKMFFLETIPNI